MHVTLPVTAAGVDAIEQATAAGVNTNAAVCFTVPQSLAVAEAVECGLDEPSASGQPIDGMSPVCTLMIGRMDDWIQVVARYDGIITDPGAELARGGGLQEDLRIGPPARLPNSAAAGSLPRPPSLIRVDRR